jgi:guanidinoacetate N-methyltransferase
LSNQNYDDALFKIGAVQPSVWQKMPAVFSEGKLSIAGHTVMGDWADSYMQELAQIATSNGGVILEIGFGIGLSANYIQQQPIDKHIVVEANEELFVKLEEFAKNATYKVEPRFGLWEEVIPSIPDESVDGVLFDSYPFDFECEEEFECDFPFFEHAYRILKKGGIFTYYSSEVLDFSPQHLQLLQSVGFSNIQKKVCAVNPPDDCLYWKSKTMIAPIVKK